jgi:pyrroline-5-carboxylate reductase
MNQEAPSQIGFIGAGHMATSLIGGMLAGGFRPLQLWASCPEPNALSKLQNQWAIHTTTDNTTVARSVQVVVLAVKPQQIKTVAEEIAPIVAQNKPLVISIAAGVRLAKLAQYLGEEVALVRCMPNTPALVRAAASVLCANPYVNREQRQIAAMILESVGTVHWVEDESALDTVTALSGCGPAYFFTLMASLEAAAVDLGLSEDLAHALTVQTALGAAQMAKATGTPIIELCRHVTSPGGATERALFVLHERQFTAIVMEAVAAAKARSEALS